MEAAYRAFKTDPATSGQFTEVEINTLGYRLAATGQPEAAMRIFELNVESHPQSWNAYDSLAEAHMNAGHAERAIDLYEKSIELNPGNSNGLAMLEKLREM